MNLEGLLGKRFDHIPLVSESIAKHHDLAIGLQAGSLQKFNSGLFEAVKVAVKIIGLQNEENATARLVADGLPLMGRIGLGQEEAGFAVSRRGDDDPALGGGQGRVLDQLKSEPFHIVGDGSVIIRNQQCDRRDMLFHAL